MRTITERRIFTAAEVDAILGQMAKMEIIGPIYYGSFGPQRVERHHDGSITVETQHTPVAPVGRTG